MNSCELCEGSGWVIRELHGLSGAKRCACSRPKVQRGKPSAEEILELVARIAASKVIPFFPQNEEAWLILTSEIQSFVTDHQALELFGRKLLRYSTKYKGPAQLRQIYCAFLVPADGEYLGEALPGFSNDEGEARGKMLEMEENARRFAWYKRQAHLMAPMAQDSGPGPFLLPEVKLIAGATAANAKPLIPANGLAKAPRRSLKEQEEELAAALKKSPARSEEERRRMIEEVEKQLAS